jgi:drug/metabolite transporter (DMT)-like permease
MNRIALGLLILCNLTWALNPLMGKALLTTYSGVQVAWLRYMSGFLAFLAVAAIGVFVQKRKWSAFFLVPKDLRVARDVAILGIGPFVLAPILQFLGLETAQAMDNSILIATEPLITVTLAWLVLGESMKRVHLVSMILAMLGLLFFTGILSSGIGAMGIGMLLLLFAQVGEGAYSVFARKLVAHHHPLAVLGTALLIAAVLLTLITISTTGLPNGANLTRAHTGAIVWLGPIGSTATYFIWASVSKRVTVASMAITLFIQPLVGAFGGYFFLGESLTAERLGGAVLILFAIAYLSLEELRGENRGRA